MSESDKTVLPRERVDGRAPQNVTVWDDHAFNQPVVTLRISPGTDGFPSHERTTRLTAQEVDDLIVMLTYYKNRMLSDE